MNVKPIVKPEVPDSFFYGDIVQWSVSPNILKDRGKYCFRINLVFSEGNSLTTRKGGFHTQKEASHIREVTITQLNNGEYVPFSYTVKEFYDYWLYYYMLDEAQISYGTFISYRNHVYNRMVPKYGNLQISDIEKSHLLNVINEAKTPGLQKQMKGMLYSSFKYAKNHNIISSNPAPTAIKQFNRMARKKEMELLKSGNQINFVAKKTFQIPTLQQIGTLLIRCKEEYADIYMPLLLAFTTGLRISETLALKFDDVDFSRMELHVTRQIGRSTSNEGIYDGTGCVQERRTKTRKAVRTVPLVDFVIDEIIMARFRYERDRDSKPYFNDCGYICHRDDGYPYNRSYPPKKFKELLKVCGVEPFRWHDIRHIYATVLKDNNVSLKAIADTLGHVSTKTTTDVYIEPKPEIVDCSIYMNKVISELLSDEKTADTGTIGISDDYISSLFK